MIAALAAALAQVALGAAPSTPLSAPAPGAQVAPSAVPEKMICKAMQQTGSLFAGPKECHSRREWDAINAASRDNVSDYQQRSRRTSGG